MNKKIENNNNAPELEPATEIYELLEDIKYLLALKTKEERLAIFK